MLELAMVAAAMTACEGFLSGAELFLWATFFVSHYAAERWLDLR
jgi:hypothetical protein